MALEHKGWMRSGGGGMEGSDIPLASTPVSFDRNLKPEDLHKFFKALENKSVPSKVVTMFRGLATREPIVRLKMNLDKTMRIMMENSVEVVIPEGLYPEELDMLREVESRGVAVQCKTVAHMLLNVEERQKLVTALGQDFKESRLAKTKIEPEED